MTPPVPPAAPALRPPQAQAEEGKGGQSRQQNQNDGRAAEEQPAGIGVLVYDKTPPARLGGAGEEQGVQQPGDGQDSLTARREALGTLDLSARQR